MGKHVRGGRRHRRRQKNVDRKITPPTHMKRWEKKLLRKKSHIIEKMLFCEHNTSSVSYSCKQCAVGATKDVCCSKMTVPNKRKEKRKKSTNNSTSSTQKELWKSFLSSWSDSVLYKVIEEWLVVNEKSVQKIVRFLDVKDVISLT